MPPPNNIKEVRRLIGLLDYYRDMLAIRSQKLQALTKLTPVSVKFILTSVENETFDEIKQIVAKYILLAYSEFN